MHKITTKRGKAQRVAHPAYQTWLCIAYLLIDWLCHCHLWKPAQRTCIHHPCKWASRSQWTKVHEIFNRSRGIIVDISAVIDVAIFPSAVECQITSAQNKDGVCQFLQKHVPQLGYCSNVRWASRRNQNLLLRSRLTPPYFLKVWRRSIQTVRWKHRKRA